jgi:hypothetical protein
MNLNEAKSQLQGVQEISTSGLVFGGTTGAVTANTEFWNGTSWTELSNLATAREGIYPAHQEDHLLLYLSSRCSSTKYNIHRRMDST